MTSKCTDQSDPRTADEKLEIATLRNAELTEKELGMPPGDAVAARGYIIQHQQLSADDFLSTRHGGTPER
jgi:hypothetical protein